jgi:hypothetical protein
MDWRETGRGALVFIGFAGSGFLSHASAEGSLVDESGWFAIKGYKATH